MTTFGDLQLSGDPDRDSDDSSDDEEYVPGREDDEASSVSGSISEEDAEEEKNMKAVTKKVKGRRRPLPATATAPSVGRARRGGIRLDGEDDDDLAAVAGASPAAAAPAEKASDAQGDGDGDGECDGKQKQRADALWASFLSDVGPRPGTSTAPASAAAAAAPSVAMATGSKRAAPASVTKIFDFAGESVAVEVPAAVPKAGGGGSGVHGLLDRLSKRPKLSTLEKSRLDWEAFTSAEGIREDLAAHNKGKAGFLERRAFLDRADHRQFERERDARLASQGGGRKL